MQSLASIFLRYGTDKHVNGYTPYYERIFESLRGEPVRVAEIGIGTLIPGVRSSMVGYGEKHYRTGASLLAWRDYFHHPESQIHGFDVQPDTRIVGEPRVTTHFLDSTDAATVQAFMGERLGPDGAPLQWDIVIDDGCHHDVSQLSTVKNFWGSVRPGGIYVVEDIYPGSRLVTEFSPAFNAAVDSAPWLLSANRNWLVVFKPGG